MKIYAGNLAPDVNEEALGALFSGYGEAFARVLRDQTSHESRGFGFVEMTDDSEARAAIEGLNGKELSGRKLVVTEAPRDMGTVLMPRVSAVPSAETAAKLLVRGGEGDGGTVALVEGVTTMGRALQNQVVVDEPGVSRQHAGILRDPDGYWITDLGSRNGTFLNGEQVGGEPRQLRDMDRIQLGGTNTPIQWVFMGAPGPASGQPALGSP